MRELVLLSNGHEQKCYVIYSLVGRAQGPDGDNFSGEHSCSHTNFCPKIETNCDSCSD